MEVLTAEVFSPGNVLRAGIGDTMPTAVMCEGMPRAASENMW
jgi:hypothetical protein